MSSIIAWIPHSGWQRLDVPLRHAALNLVTGWDDPPCPDLVPHTGSGAMFLAPGASVEKMLARLQMLDAGPLQEVATLRAHPCPEHPASARLSHLRGHQTLWWDQRCRLPILAFSRPRAGLSRHKQRELSSRGLFALTLPDAHRLFSGEAIFAAPYPARARLEEITGHLTQMEDVMIEGLSDRDSASFHDWRSIDPERLVDAARLVPLDILRTLADRALDRQRGAPSVTGSAPPLPRAADRLEAFPFDAGAWRIVARSLAGDPGLRGFADRARANAETVETLLAD